VPYQVEFDSTNQILRARFEGRVTDEELKAYYQRAREIVAQINPRAGITDFSAVTSFEVSPDTIRGLANLPPAMPDPAKPRFIVAPTPYVFGMARMFEIEGKETRPNNHVVRTMREVCAVLGVPE
jgi:hypothetical protein